MFQNGEESSEFYLQTSCVFMKSVGFPSIFVFLMCMHVYQSCSGGTLPFATYTLSDKITCVEVCCHYAPASTDMVLTASIDVVLWALMGPECFANTTEPTESDTVP